ncbi:hypothetical protein LCGC14_1158120 [marine sediment metagenome]|uniref:Uncharacterized protein n=1 Tax=marine sediment metagenome TaxID=412755 RepID=A0A0F9LYI8_9ZZZZ
MKIVFKDGSVYIPYNYSGKEHELENNIIEHRDIIFGEKSVFLEKTKIQTWENKTTIPDGFVLLLEEEKWFIIEIELNEHSYKSHILPQLLGFIGSIDILSNKTSLINAFYSEIRSNNKLKSRVET